MWLYPLAGLKPLTASAKSSSGYFFSDSCFFLLGHPLFYSPLLLLYGSVFSSFIFSASRIYGQVKNQILHPSSPTSLSSFSFKVRWRKTFLSPQNRCEFSLTLPLHVSPPSTIRKEHIRSNRNKLMSYTKA